MQLPASPRFLANRKLTAASLANWASATRTWRSPGPMSKRATMFSMKVMAFAKSACLILCGDTIGWWGGVSGRPAHRPPRHTLNVLRCRHARSEKACFARAIRRLTFDESTRKTRSSPSLHDGDFAATSATQSASTKARGRLIDLRCRTLFSRRRLRALFSSELIPTVGWWCCD